MVLIDITLPWVKPEQFEQRLDIVKVDFVKGKFGTEIELHLLELHTGTVYRMSVYGKNKNFLVNTYGPETAAWLGKPIMISLDLQNGKDVRVLRVPK